MALVITKLQQKHCLKLESEFTKWSQSGISVRFGRGVYMFLLGSTVAYFGGHREIDVSSDVNEKPYL